MILENCTRTLVLRTVGNIGLVQLLKWANNTTWLNMREVT